MKKFGSGLFLFLFIIVLPCASFAGDAQQISIGDNIFDETQCATQEYAFPSVAGERFVVAVTECPDAPSCGTNDGFNPCVRLEDPLREMCLSDTLPGATAEFRFTAPADGDHFLSVYDGGGNKSGWFNLFVQSLTDPRGYARVELGEDIVGTVSQCGEVDSYVFSGSAGEVATFDFESTDESAVCGRYQLYDPTGTLLFTFIEQVSGSGGIQWELPMDGDYLLLVSSCNTTTGAYVVSTGSIRPTTTTTTTSTTTTTTTTSTTTTSSSTTTTTLEPECRVCADHNGINDVSATDALMILNTSVGFDVGMECDAGCPVPCGDHDGNGRVLASDSLKVLRYAVELLTCEEFNAYLN